ncbi:hypothetical protein CPB84DRAFT_1767825 [Gymnopilus junonius]|uniref:Serine protease n=1 Tax=Gymnopilus junonius TaxID=109634 RepID=A0A9P5NSU1_GYMJU|nr:hypothetical protein CPB84DRAFT_1767825 [Gymnopilus junonius]
MDNPYDLWENPEWSRRKFIQDDNDDDGRNVDGKAESFTGNGFFLRLPNLMDKYVILTAAHNVMSEGKRSFDVKLMYNNPFEADPNDPTKVRYANGTVPQAIITLDIDNTDKSNDVHICSAYMKGVPVGDYAAICIPRKLGEPRGFAFSVKLALRSSFEGNVHVSGFRTTMMKTLRPVTSSAAKLIYHGDYVEYRAKTEVGISGSPVWVEYKGYPTVVAVHNNGPEDPDNPRNGSRGALLTVDLLRDVFEWLDSKLLLKGIQIQVRQQDLDKSSTYRAAGRKLFLNFQTNSDFGRVRLDSGTKFDWMLAQVDSQNVYYILSVVGQRKWVKFNLAASKYQGVELSENLNGKGCLLLNLEEARRAWVILAVETGTIENGAPKRVQLRMEGNRVKTYDAQFESAEVSLMSSKGKNPFYKLVMTT